MEGIEGLTAEDASTTPFLHSIWEIVSDDGRENISYKPEVNRAIKNQTPVGRPPPAYVGDPDSCKNNTSLACTTDEGVLNTLKASPRAAPTSLPT